MINFINYYFLINNTFKSRSLDLFNLLHDHNKFNLTISIYSNNLIILFFILKLLTKSNKKIRSNFSFNILRKFHEDNVHIPHHLIKYIF